MFIGVPCDIGALKIYLGKEYDNMITVQLVCMGVTSPRIFKEMMKTILHDSSKIKDIKERFTYKNWSIPFISIHTDEKKNILYPLIHRTMHMHLIPWVESRVMTANIKEITELQI